MKFIINKTERRLKNITYQTDHDLYATYKGYDIQVAEQETGGFYATVKDPKGKKIIDNHVGGLYLNEAVKDVMITICFKISRESAKRLNEVETKQCNIPHVVLRSEQLPPQICYKTNEPCKYNCQGLCKESC